MRPKSIVNFERVVLLNILLGIVNLVVNWDKMQAAQQAALVAKGQARMAGNVGIDAVLGAIPVVGFIPDFLFRSNSRNLRIIRKWLDKHHPAVRTIEGELVRLAV